MRPERRDVVYELIDRERAYQEERWNRNTTSSHDFHSPEEWMQYIQVYTWEAIQKSAHTPDPFAKKELMASMRKIAAMAVAAMEQHETPGRDMNDLYDRKRADERMGYVR